MESFLSTLVQTTAALIAVLLAAIAAYFVFLQGKSAEYDDKIDLERAAIRTEISGLQAQWPGGIQYFLPPEFKERFSARTGNSHGVELIEKFSVGIIFSSPELQAALSDVANVDTFGQEHWKGRAYAVALTEVVNVLSGGARIEPGAFTLGKPEPKVEASSAFPRSPTGLGFEQWRKDFDRVSTALRFFEPAPIAIADFEAFQKSHPQLGSAQYTSLLSKGVNALFSSVNAIRAHLRALDNLCLSQSRYSFYARVHGKSLLMLISATTFVGVVVPLFALASPVARLSRLTTNGFLLATIVLMTSAFVQFGFDVFQPLQPDPRLYVIDRWLRPIMEELDHSGPQPESAAPIQIERVIEFLSSNDASRIPSELRDELSKYREYVHAYNSSAEQLDSAALRHLQNDPEFASFRRPYLELGQRQRVTIHPSDLAVTAAFERLRGSLLGTEEVVLAVETQYSWGSRGRLSLIAASGNRNSLISGLAGLSTRLTSSREAQDLHEKHAKVMQLYPVIKAHLSRNITR